MKGLTLYRCPVCGNLACMIEDSGVTPICCGGDMTRLMVNTTDASVEKHVPVTRREDGRVTVTVGETPHPMTEKHFISHIFLLTDRGLHMAELTPDDPPEAAFALDSDEAATEAYALCNLHGLWGAAAK